MNGKIIPLQLEAYDSDGLAGIYCPEASKSVKTATDDLITVSRILGHNSTASVEKTYAHLLQEIAEVYLERCMKEAFEKR